MSCHPRRRFGQESEPANIQLFKHSLIHFLSLPTFKSSNNYDWVRRTSLKTMLTAEHWCLSASRTSANLRFAVELTLEHATYNWPCAKTCPRSHTHACFKVWPCDLLIIIAYAGLTGNCRRWHSNGYSFALGMNVIRGMRMILPVSTLLHWSS